jgi:phage portal protein BeeE
VGAGNTSYSGTSGMDMDTDNQELLTTTREANKHEGDVDMPTGESLGTTQEWDVNPDAVKDGDEPKGKPMSEEAGKKLEQIADNPSDDALFHRQDATYLEGDDNPNEGYDPHDKGYTGKDKTDAQ